jgi:hypothetical protein
MRMRGIPVHFASTIRSITLNLAAPSRICDPNINVSNRPDPISNPPNQPKNMASTEIKLGGASVPRVVELPCLVTTDCVAPTHVWFVIVSSRAPISSSCFVRNPVMQINPTILFSSFARAAAFWSAVLSSTALGWGGASAMFSICHRAILLTRGTDGI